MLNEKVYTIHKREVIEGIITGEYISKQTGYKKIEVSTKEVVVQSDEVNVFNTQEEAEKYLPDHIAFIEEMLTMIKKHQEIENTRRKEIIGEPMIEDLSIFKEN